MLLVTRPLFIIILGLFVCYFPVAELGFVSDDHGLISHPVTGVGQQSLASIFSGDLWHFQESQSGYYRPLLMLSLLLDHTIFDTWSGGYHLHSLIWHILAVTFLFGILRRPFGDGRATIATCLFAFHPLVSEQVCFISARNDSMAIALGLAAVALTMPSRVSTKRCLAASILAAAACLSKEIGVIVLCLLPLMDWARRKNGGWHRYAALAAGAVAWLYIREMVGPGLLHAPPMNGAELMKVERLTVIGTLVSKVVWPIPLTDSMHMAYMPSITWPALAASVFLIVFLVSAAGRWAQMGVLFFVLALIPGLMAIASRFLVGERYLTLPLIGICFGIAAVLPKAIRAQWAILIAIPLAIVSHARIHDWRSDLSLAQAAYSAQATGYTASWLAHELLQSNQAERAFELYDEATRADPPTCDFAGEWLRAVRLKEGGSAGVVLGRNLWKRRCAAAPGVRGEWAHSFLSIGELAMAEKILSPPPQRCGISMVVPLVTVLRLQGETDAALQCMETSGATPAQIEPAITRLMNTNAQPADEKPTDAPVPTAR